MKNKKYHLGVHPFLFLLGYERIRVDRQALEPLLNLCRRLDVSYWDVDITEDCAELCVRFFGSNKLIKEAEKQGLSPTVAQSGGLPPLRVKHRARAGIGVGLILSILLIILSGEVIWDIRVDGEKSVSEEEIEALLDTCGIRVGSWRRGLDVSVIENRALILSDSISWISINIRGTIANVEIRELDFAPEDEELPPASNLISDGEGVIVRIEDARGNIAVGVGDAVSRGQLLIGGIYGDEDDPFKYTSATGKVFAECEEVFSVDIPRTYQKKVYSDRRKIEKYFIFLKKEIKFFTNCGNLPPTCDKIEMIEYFRAPNGDELPVGIKTVIYREYSYEETTRSDEELSQLASYRLQSEVSSALPDAEILGITTEFHLSEEGFTLTRRLRCVRNIAVRQKIDVE